MKKMTVLQGVLLPFLGTALGAAFVFFFPRGLSQRITGVLCGFAGGVMTAAGVWSLLLPAIDRSAHLGAFAFAPALIGFLLGGLSLWLWDKWILAVQQKKGTHSRLFFAVTLHNVPEGLAIGVALAAYLASPSVPSAASVLALATGVAIQNVPEGAVISLPLQAEGVGRGRAFAFGVLSGAVEPIAALIAIPAALAVSSLLPYLLSYAAGCMIYVTVKELVPTCCGEEGRGGAPAFMLGFALMMLLDVALG